MAKRGWQVKVEGSAEGSGRQAGGYALGIGAALLLSLTGLFIALISRRHGAAALVIAIWRDVFTALAIALGLAVLAPRRLRVRPSDLLYLGANGAVLALFNLFWTLSVVRNGAAAATLLVYSSGGFTVLLGRFLLREGVGYAKAGAALASLLGAALVSGVFTPGAGPAGLAGVAWGLGSGLAYAAYSLVGRGGALRGIDSWTTVCYSFGVAALVLLGLRALPGLPLPASALGPGELFLPGRPAEAWLLLIALAAFPTAFGFGLYNACLAVLPAGTANLLASTEPIFAAITAYLFLGERLGPVALAGGGLILLAVVLLRLADRRAVGSERRVTEKASDRLAETVAETAIPGN